MHIPLLTVHLFPCMCTQMAMRMYYNVEYTIHETTCTKSTEAVTAENCPHMSCEFAVSCAKLLYFLCCCFFLTFYLVKRIVFNIYFAC